MSAACPICIDDYKGKKIVKVTCQYCPSHACRGCQQRYLLQSYEDPHCMECKRGWSSEFMAANFPMCFRGEELRKHRRKILFEREKAMLPAMQIFVEYKRQMQANWKAYLEASEGVGTVYHDLKEGEAPTLGSAYRLADKEYRKVNQELSEVRVKIVKLSEQIAEGGPQDAALKEERRLLREERTTLKEMVELLHEDSEARYEAFTVAQAKAQEFATAYYRYSALYEGRDGGGDSAAVAAAARREFIMRCPADDCRGFLSSAYKCGTCAKWTCSDCLVCIGDDKNAAHTCDKDTVESAKAIKSETRPCPKCGTRIFKIDGCDQMWCVMDGCHTAFSWNTGHVVTGVVHNPHYYEWLRRNGGGAAPREHGDIPCGGLPGGWQFQQALGVGGGRVHYFHNNEITELLNIHRSITDLIHVRLHEYPARPPANQNKEIDVRYLMKDITEEEWMRQLELAEAKFLRKKEIGQILQMLATTASDMLNRVVVQSQTAYRGDNRGLADWYRTALRPELEGLRVFTNESLKELAKRQHQAVPQFSAQWFWEPLRALYRKGPTAAQKRKAAAAAAAAATAETPAAQPQPAV